jgi:ABC-type nitrate/sulfonate/bicarbonate transport system permease component
VSPHVTSPRRRAATWVAPAAFLVFLVGAWEAWCRLGHVAPWVLPPPSSVARSGWNLRGPLFGHAMTTLAEAVIGLAIGVVVGLAVALAISAVPAIRRAVWPVVVTSQTIPVIVLAPLLAIWFGFGLQPKVALVALVTFFPVAVSAVAGLAGADDEQVELVRSFGASRAQVLRLVRIPAALPEVVAGVRIAAAYAIGDAVVGEYVGGTSGLGIFIDRSRASYRTDQMLAGVAVIAVLSIVLFGLTGLIGRLLTPWKQAGTPTRRGTFPPQGKSTTSPDVPGQGTTPAITKEVTA